MPFYQKSRDELMEELRLAREEVAALKLSESAWKERSLLLDASQSMAKIGGWQWDNERRVMLWTREVYRIHGMDPDAVSAGSQEFVEQGFDCYAEKDRGRIRSLFDRCVQHGEAYDEIFPFTPLNGGFIWIRTTAVPVVKKGRIVRVLGNIMDVSDLKKMEMELQKMQRSVEDSPVSIVITDTHGTIEYVNPAFTDVTGYSFSEAVGQNPRIMKSGMHDTHFYTELWNTLVRGDIWKGEICNRRKDGALFWEQVSIAPVKSPEGDITHFLGVKDDISDKKELDRIKEDMERVMHHDLKTPLNGIIGLPQILLMDDNLTEEQTEIIRLIEDSGRKMLDFIDQSMDFYKMETGTYVCNKCAVDAFLLMRQLVRKQARILEQKKLMISLLVDGKKGGKEDRFVVEAEEKLLYFLFSNLFMNAVEASPEGESIEIDFISTRPKCIAMCNKGEVPREIRDFFFEKYKTYGKTRGTGLGTYSAWLMARAMGYGIDMHTSDEKQNTRIRILIPCEI
ncbi:PAS domain S-box protein [Desulfobotulus sp. H1]|uniref:histidine kinase n=1 Tax=Desulfobotulus pelophilus TaxID=2823377 RepID=A0ABT3N9E0_9BACT|nr:PAS domain S-box protein [Desulfobotulus pelophilus]MCW7753781.1 PAS domain S-box protein [Desulfobotulus pelophilus]